MNNDLENKKQYFKDSVYLKYENLKNSESTESKKGCSSYYCGNYELDSICWNYRKYNTRKYGIHENEWEIWGKFSFY